MSLSVTSAGKQPVSIPQDDPRLFQSQQELIQAIERGHLLDAIEKAKTLDDQTLLTLARKVFGATNTQSLEIVSKLLSALEEHQIEEEEELKYWIAKAANRLLQLICMKQYIKQDRPSEQIVGRVGEQLESLLEKLPEEQVGCHVELECCRELINRRLEQDLTFYLTPLMGTVSGAIERHDNEYLSFVNNRLVTEEFKKLMEQPDAPWIIKSLFLRWVGGDPTIELGLVKLMSEKLLLDTRMEILAAAIEGYTCLIKKGSPQVQDLAFHELKALAAFVNSQKKGGDESWKVRLRAAKALSHLAKSDARHAHAASQYLLDRRIDETEGEVLNSLAELSRDPYFSVSWGRILHQEKDRFQKKLREGAAEIQQLEHKLIEKEEALEKAGKSTKSLKKERLAIRAKREIQEKQSTNFSEVYSELIKPFEKKPTAVSSSSSKAASQPAELSPFECPITHEQMYDPVQAADGYTYERKAIEEWLEEKSTSPMTSEELANKDLTPNQSLRSQMVAAGHEVAPFKKGGHSPSSSSSSSAATSASTEKTQENLLVVPSNRPSDEKHSASLSNDNDNFGSGIAMSDPHIAESNGAMTPEKRFQKRLQLANDGDSYAQLILGDHYYFGAGVEQNYAEAVEWYRKSSEADALFKLGICLAEGKGVPTKNEIEAFQCFKRAAAKNHLPSLNQMGACYKKGLGIDTNLVEAFCSFKQAAIEGYLEAKVNLGHCYRKGRGTAQRFDRAFHWYKEAAEGGHPEGQLNLAACYDNGVGIEKNQEKAAKWFNESAIRGNKKAQFALGSMYYNGQGVPENKEEAIHWLTKAATGGIIDSQFFLGLIYMHGDGVDASDEEAIKWFEKAAQQGHHPSQQHLACLLEKIRGGYSDDPDGALRWYIAAAEGGEAEAQHSAGRLLIDENPKEGANWYLKAAEQGHIEAQCYLAVCYAKGLGVDADHKKAIEWMKKSAEAGYVTAWENLGKWYLEGKVVQKNPQEAVEWLERAAANDFHEAQRLLGQCYALGEGVSKNVQKAFEWFEKAAQLGDPEAQFNLGECYSKGKGVHKDAEKAREWYLKAAENGYPEAQLWIGDSFRYGWDIPIDHTKAFEWYGKAAEQGQKNAQCYLAICYQFGNGTQEDFGKAIEWYTKSAKQGLVKAQVELGDCFLREDRNQYNPQKAFEWYQKAARRGDSVGLINLGHCYRDGKGTPKNIPEAVRCYREASKRGGAYIANQCLKELGCPV